MDRSYFLSLKKMERKDVKIFYMSKLLLLLLLLVIFQAVSTCCGVLSKEHVFSILSIFCNPVLKQLEGLTHLFQHCWRKT